MDRQPVRSAARPMLRWLATAVCGCAAAALGGCGRSASRLAKAGPVPDHSAATSSMSSNLAATDSPGPSARLPQNAPHALPLTSATTIANVVRSEVVPVAYPPAQSSDGGDAPRVRLAQVQPLPLAADGPALEPPQQSNGPANDNHGDLSPFPPIAPPIAPPSVAPAAQPPGGPTGVVPISSRFTQAAAAPASPAPPVHSAELDAVIRQANAQTAHGFELAQRGAIYSSRAEFIAALHTIAASLDAANTGEGHDRKLTAGLRALDEADDFVSQGATAQSDIDVAHIVAGHQTPVLKDTSLSGLSSTAALSRYLTFAQEQLAGCTAGMSAGSAALFGLGKLYRVPESLHGPADPTHGAKAVALYQAALIVDSRNYRAANELGVLLAQFGRLPEAKAALLRSVSIFPQPTAWHNLAAVHRTLGERDLAERANQESILAAARMNRGGAAGQSYAVRWLDPATFASTTPLNIDGTPPAASNQQNNVAAGTSTAAKR